MMRVGTSDRLGPAQAGPVRATPGATERAPAEAAGPSGRALIVIEGGRPQERGRPAQATGTAVGRASAGFVAQLLTADDPTLLPSRLERTQMAAARYAEAARRLA